MTAPLDEAPSTVPLRVERFGSTAKTITYGVLGDALSYWSFFPATLPEAGGLGPARRRVELRLS